MILLRRAATSIAALTVACWCMTSIAAAAAVQVSSESATQAYLRDLNTLTRSESAQAGASVTAIKNEVINVGRKCPSALAGAREGGGLVEVDKEVSDAVVISGLKPYAGMMVKFAVKTENIHPINHELTQLFRSAASLARMEATIAVPDVCGAIRAWVRAGYGMVPRDAIQFVRKVEAINRKAVDYREGRRLSLIQRIFQAIRPHESSSGMRLAARLRRIGAAVRIRIERANRRGIHQVELSLRSPFLLPGG